MDLENSILRKEDLALRVEMLENYVSYQQEKEEIRRQDKLFENGMYFGILFACSLFFIALITKRITSKIIW